jgi:hypothetical protein
MFGEGKPLLTEVGRDLRLELRLTWKGGTRILQKIEEAEYDVLSQRPTLSFFNKASLLVSSFIG